MPRKSEPAAARSRKIARYGWKPDLPDQRDYSYAVPHLTAAALPVRVDLRSRCPKTVYDQGQLGSCTANAIAAAIEFDQIKEKLPQATPSRLFIYYNERVIEGTSPAVDSGAQIRDGVKSVATLGACAETAWPYSDDNKSPSACPSCPYARKPSAAAVAEAARHRIKVYERLTTGQISTLKGCLASGYPFVFGFTVYDSFESAQVAKTGIVPMPGPQEHVLGGHAVLAVGYDDATSRFIVRNSWGPGWGMKGYFTLPYLYLASAQLADDFWTIRTV